MKEKVVLAYSGGLDTSVAIHWLQERFNLDVITLTVDITGDRNLEGVREKALKLGALKAITVQASETFVKFFVFPALKADALYEGVYPLATALSRPLIARLLVDVAHEEGASFVAHGCTGKGNDQVRFDVGVKTLDPGLKIIAPAREWGMSREETIDYAHRHNIPVPATVSSPYSIDDNLWGRSIECGVLEDPWREPPDDVFSWTNSPLEAPDKPAFVEIEFDKGVPVMLDGENLPPAELVVRLNELAGLHGVGRIDHIEDRLVGIKSREIYEAPAAVTLLGAHQALESLTLSRDQIRVKRIVAQEYARLVYDGLWYTAHHQDLASYVDSTQRFVSGTVRMKLFKGNCITVGRRSPYSLYNYDLATYEKGDQFDHKSSPGFINIWGLSSSLQSRVQPLDEDDPGHIINWKDAK